MGGEFYGLAGDDVFFSFVFSFIYSLRFFIHCLTIDVIYSRARIFFTHSCRIQYHLLTKSRLRSSPCRQRSARGPLSGPHTQLIMANDLKNPSWDYTIVLRVPAI